MLRYILRRIVQYSFLALSMSFLVLLIGNEALGSKFFEVVTIGLIFGLIQAIFSKYAVGSIIERNPFVSFIVLCLLLMFCFGFYYLFKSTITDSYETKEIQLFISADKDLLLSVPPELIDREELFYDALSHRVLNLYLQNNDEVKKNLNESPAPAALMHFGEMATLFSFLDSSSVARIETFCLPKGVANQLLMSKNPNLVSIDLLKNFIKFKNLRIKDIEGIDSNLIYSFLNTHGFDLQPFADCLADLQIQIPESMKVRFDRPKWNEHLGPTVGLLSLKNDFVEMDIWCSFPHGNLTLATPQKFPPFTDLAERFEGDLWWRVPLQITVHISYNWIMSLRLEMKYYQKWAERTKENIFKRLYWARLEDSKELVELISIRRSIEALKIGDLKDSTRLTIYSKNW